MKIEMAMKLDRELAAYGILRIASYHIVALLCIAAFELPKPISRNWMQLLESFSSIENNKKKTTTK